MSSVEHYAPNFLIVVNGVKLQHGVTVDVLSVTVTETVNQADTFAFTVRDSHPEPVRLFAGGNQLKWMDSDVFKEGNKVEIHMGYVDDLHLMLKGKINGGQSNFPESGQPTLQVQGYSRYQELQHRRRREPFEATIDSKIAEEIAKDMGMQAEVTETKAKHPLFSPRGHSYANILQERAGRLGFEVSVKGDALVFQKPRYLTNPGPAFTFEWGRNLRSFSPRVSTNGMPTVVKVRASQTTQGKGKKPLVGQAKAGDERVKLGRETGTQVAKRLFKDHTVLISDHDVVTQEEANEMALCRLEAQSMGFIKGDGSVIGEPRLRARMVIELTGLRQRFSGRYYVTSTTHTIDGSGYRTTFKVERNAR